jgi:uncharacterized membrane protein SirB2
LNAWLLEFAEWLGSTSFSTDLHESFYMYAWIESAHVVTLTISLGMLIVIDLRMLGLWLTDVPASKIAARLNRPMLIGFTLMFITGVLLYIGIPIRTTQSLWFRIKMLLLVAAAINAWLFHRHLNLSVNTWDTAKLPPRRTRVAAILSLSLWSAVIFCGRFIAYDWFDCGTGSNSAFVDWAAGCTAGDVE